MNLFDLIQFNLTCAVAIDVDGSAVELAQRLHLQVVPVHPQETLSPHIPGMIFNLILKSNEHYRSTFEAQLLAGIT